MVMLSAVYCIQRPSNPNSLEPPWTALLTVYISVSAEKCSGQCVARNVAYLQEHKACQTGQRVKSQDTSEEISPGDLFVSQFVAFVAVWVPST